MTIPVLVELTRGAYTESRHHGSIAISRANGELVFAVGDVSQPVFPRSAIKAFQALPLVESGAADRFKFGNREIALACASHSGTTVHTKLAADMLSRAGQSASALACGPQNPVHDDSAFALRRDGIAPTALENNCSGKHSGMIATCVHCGDPVGDYVALDHPHQKRIATALAEMTHATATATNAGIDGCSAPNWAIPLSNLARGFAALVSGEGLSPTRKAACQRIATACMAEPNLVAGPGRLDTRAMTALPGKVFMKTGAEGVYCGAFPSTGIGFALKVDDGTTRASQALMEAILQKAFPDAPAFGNLGPITNWRGTQTGVTRLSASLLADMRGLKL